MNCSTRLIALILLALGAGFGCLKGSENPAAPPAQINPAQSISGYSAQSSANDAHTHLWGFYDVYLDFESRTIEAVPNRQIEFAANVVTFLNKDPDSVQFIINDTPVGGGYICADVDVSITHPFPGMHNTWDTM